MVNILFLGEENNKIIDYFKKNDIKFISTTNKINCEYIISCKRNIIISYKYRYIIKKDVIDLNIPIINLHISYLPFNRGADPNLWSFIDNTKKGITIHLIDSGIDTGPILYQQEYFFKDDTETLRSSYDFLNNEIQELFILHFCDIIKNNYTQKLQILQSGTYNSSNRKKNLMKIIMDNGGYDIQINKLNKIFCFNNFKNTYIIAELSCNHNQDLNIALNLVEEAAKCGANAIKLQTYTPDTITIDCKTDIFKIKGTHLWDDQYLYDLYKKAYTPWEWHSILFAKAKELGMDSFSSPFDTTAVDFLEKLNVPCYKVASCEITDHILLKKIAKTNKPVIISSGMASKEELKEAVDILRTYGTPEICMLKCTAEYPAKQEDANLITIKDMIESFNVIGGLSDHTLGIEVPIASVLLGAKVIEKHFTLSRNSGSPDDAFSLTPDEFKQMVDSIRIIEKTIGKITYGGVKGEEAMKKFRRSLFFVKDMKNGEIIDETCVRSIRPGNGLHTKYYDDVIGKKSKDVERGTPVSFDNFN